MSNWEDVGCFKSTEIIIVGLFISDNTAVISRTNSTAKVFILFMNTASEIFLLYVFRGKGNNEHEDQGLSEIGLQHVARDSLD
jgi:hypothetical protein